MKNNADKYSHMNRFIKLIWKDVKPVIVVLAVLLLMVGYYCAFVWYISTAFKLSLYPEAQLGIVPLTNNQLGLLMIYIPLMGLIYWGISKYVRSAWQKSK